MATSPPPPEAPELSLVIPFLNEEEPAGPLLDEVRQVLDRHFSIVSRRQGPHAFTRGPDDEVPPGERYEVIAVDDGSTDGTAALLDSAAKSWSLLRVIHLARTCGQSGALAAGFFEARGEWIATLDGDGQSDPADIPRLLAAREGYDMVTGIRALRRDTFVRRASSRIAYRVRNAVLHDGIIDTGCSTRVFRRALVRDLPLAFRGMHRFLPALIRMAGGRILQVPVNHRPRSGGRAKYGIGNRMLPGLHDLLAVRWMMRRFSPPWRFPPTRRSSPTPRSSPPWQSSPPHRRD